VLHLEVVEEENKNVLSRNSPRKHIPYARFAFGSPAVIDF
jgi:hypothetical protein